LFVDEAVWNVRTDFEPVEPEAACGSVIVKATADNSGRQA
jgi:hypothetical protein